MRYETRVSRQVSIHLAGCAQTQTIHAMTVEVMLQQQWTSLKNDSSNALPHTHDLCPSQARQLQRLYTAVEMQGAFSCDLHRCWSVITQESDAYVSMQPTSMT